MVLIDSSHHVNQITVILLTHFTSFITFTVYLRIELVGDMYIRLRCFAGSISIFYTYRIQIPIVILNNSRVFVNNNVINDDEVDGHGSFHLIITLKTEIRGKCFLFIHIQSKLERKCQFLLRKGQNLIALEILKYLLGCEFF